MDYLLFCSTVPQDREKCELCGIVAHMSDPMAVSSCTRQAGRLMGAGVWDQGTPKSNHQNVA